MQSRRVGPTLIETWFFAEDAGLAAGYLDSAAAALERFTRLIGPFPVERWAMVENRLPTGYAYPGFTLLGQAVVRLPFIRDTALVHEVAHAWFGTAVQVDPAGGDWAEGLTAYLADHGTAEASGTGPAHRKGLLTRIEAYAHGEQAIPLTAFRGAPNLDSKNRALRAVGYDKGALLFHMLCRRIGERAFVDGLQRLYTEYRDRRAGWPEVTAAFAAEAGKDLRPFFAQWLERTDLPVLAIDKAHLDQREGVTRLRFELVQQTTPPFDLSVPVRVQTLLGATTRQVHTASVRRAAAHLGRVPRGSGAQRPPARGRRPRRVRAPHRHPAGGGLPPGRSGNGDRPCTGQWQLALSRRLVPAPQPVRRPAGQGGRLQPGGAPLAARPGGGAGAGRLRLGR